MSNSQDFKYLAVPNWDNHQVVDRKGQNIKRYIKDYCTKDCDDLEYSRLHEVQRYYVDAIYRLRGRLGKNVPNDVKFISRALCIRPESRHCLQQILDKLVASGFLVLTNQEVGLSDSDSESESDTETDSYSSSSGFAGTEEEELFSSSDNSFSRQGKARAHDSRQSDEPTVPVRAKSPTLLSDLGSPSPVPPPPSHHLDEATTLAVNFTKKLNRTGTTMESATPAFQRLRERYSYGHIKNVMNFLFEKGDHFLHGIQVVNKTPPAEWFVSRFDDIADKMKADDAYDSATKKKANQGKAEKFSMAYTSELYSQFDDDGDDWTEEAMAFQKVFDSVVEGGGGEKGMEEYILIKKDVQRLAKSGIAYDRINKVFAFIQSDPDLLRRLNTEDDTPRQFFIDNFELLAEMMDRQESNISEDAEPEDPDARKDTDAMTAASSSE